MQRKNYKSTLKKQQRAENPSNDVKMSCLADRGMGTLKKYFFRANKAEKWRIFNEKMENCTGYDQVPFSGFNYLKIEHSDRKIAIITSWSNRLKIILPLK